MRNDFPPSREADLLGMAQNFSTKVTATPVPYGYTAALATQTAAAVSAYSDAYAMATDPATRTKANIAIKDDKRQLLVENLRMMNRIAQSNPAITNGQKIELGLPVYNARTPLPIPEEAPVMEVVSTIGRTTKISLRSVGTERRGRPFGVQGAIVISWTGPNPPDDITKWTTQGLPTRTTFDVVFPPTVPAGTQVWISAAWYNPRGQAGPACTPVSVYIAGGLGVTQTNAHDSTDGESMAKAA